MDNKRLAELNELLASQVVASDLFLIGDQSVPESKRITATNLQTYILNGSASYAMSTLSSSYAGQAGSASYAPCISASYAKTASWASWVVSASYSSSSLSASYALSASWASRCISASYASTSSVQLVISSANATYAQSASHLMYTAGFNNGTSSYSISSSLSKMSVASINNLSSSWASSSLSSSYVLGTNVSGPVPTAVSALYTSVVGNGVFNKLSVLCSGSQTQPNILVNLPDTASTLAITFNASITAPTVLINMSVAVGGVTGVALWRNSIYDAPNGTSLIASIAMTSASLGGLQTISATYVDSLPFVLVGDSVSYYGCVYNPNGLYFLNRSFDGSQFGTSSLSVIEF